ncbi:MAG TPA: cell wall-binding repeat-containing protein [Humibacter sp.]|nr:cell wall-binding repeat-containing protein [Humibacter sp.]
MQLTRRFVAGLAVLCCVLAGVGAFDQTSAPTAAAADAANFKAGNIISDTVFYNSAAMSSAQIQSFLNAKVPSCRSGYTCLKGYRQTTATRTADAYCAAYSGASSETAATIIAKVASACDINPQVILVTLEKEESLVTDTWPGARQYRSAMGFGCPDTSGCDATYDGFFNQVYSAAHQFQVYRDHPTWFNHQAGRTENIRYNPNEACGSKSVTIANQATAGLYNYTPYTPNAAALNNLYGVGDSCSAYGNRNFWVLFTDWFGSTQAYSVATQLSALWTSTGGSTGSLGYAVNTPLSFSGGGVGQTFQKGWAYWGPTTGAFATYDTIGRSFNALNGPSGILGYPVASVKSETGSGLSQAFQRGSLYSPSSGHVHRVLSILLADYLSTGGPEGPLRWPTDSTGTLPDGGAAQPFQGGNLYWSKWTGVFSVTGSALNAYIAAGGPSGKLGYPITDVTKDPGGISTQSFEYGSLSWSGTAPATATMRPIPNVGRIAGADRYATAVAISQAQFTTTAPVVYVATGQDFPDALSAAASAAKQGGPLLLTPTAKLPTSALREVQRLKPQKIIVVGSVAVVSDSVVSALRAVAPVTRVGGADRYQTSLALANYAFGAVGSAYVATGANYPDAISAAAVAGAVGAPVILVDGTKATVPTATLDSISAHHPSSVIVAGSNAVVSDGIVQQLSTRASTTRLFGSDRYATNRALNASATRGASSFLATGSDYPDALVGAVLAGRSKAPLFLAKSTCVPAPTWISIALTGSPSVTLFGSVAVLSAGVAALERCS